MNRETIDDACIAQPRTTKLAFLPTLASSCRTLLDILRQVELESKQQQEEYPWVKPEHRTILAIKRKFMNRILEREEEAVLFRFYDQYKDDSQYVEEIKQIHDYLYLFNQGLVLSICSQYAKLVEGMSLELEDLFMEGLLGLSKAIEGFDIERGHKFSTYAVPTIRNKILRYIDNNARLAKFPSQLRRTKIFLTENQQRFSQEFHRQPTIEELHEYIHAHHDADHIRRAFGNKSAGDTELEDVYAAVYFIHASSNTLGLDHPVENAEDGSIFLHETIIDPSSHFETVVGQENEIVMIGELIDTMTSSPKKSIRDEGYVLGYRMGILRIDESFLDKFHTLDQGVIYEASATYQNQLAEIYSMVFGLDKEVIQPGLQTVALLWLVDGVRDSIITREAIRQIQKRGKERVGRMISNDPKYQDLQYSNLLTRYLSDK